MEMAREEEEEEEEVLMPRLRSAANSFHKNSQYLIIKIPGIPYEEELVAKVI